MGNAALHNSAIYDQLLDQVPVFPDDPAGETGDVFNWNIIAILFRNRVSARYPFNPQWSISASDNKFVPPYVIPIVVEAV